MVSVSSSICQKERGTWLGFVTSHQDVSRCIDQYLAFASSLLNTFAFANFGFSSSRVGILWGHLFKLAFSFCGSKHIRSDPSFFMLKARLEHQSVCSSTFHKTPWLTSLFNSFLSLFNSFWSLSLMWILHLRGGSMNGLAPSFRMSFAVPLKLPILSNSFGYFSFSSLMLFMCCQVLSFVCLPSFALFSFSAIRLHQHLLSQGWGAHMWVVQLQLVQVHQQRKTLHLSIWILCTGMAWWWFRSSELHHQCMMLVLHWMVVLDVPCFVLMYHTCKQWKCVSRCPGIYFQVSMSLQEGWFNVQSWICLISGWFHMDAVHALCTDSDGVKVFLVCILIITFDAIYNINAGL